MMQKAEYIKYISKVTPKSSQLSTMLKAFLVGGVICVVGQGFIELYKMWGAPPLTASVYGSCTLILLASLLTGLSLYDSIAIFGGAGSTVPITGFSNAMTAPAIEFKSEGLIYGLSSKMMIVAGPVLVNGIAASMIVGLIYYIFGL